MPHNLIDDLVEASPNRRKFLKTIAAATAGVSALSMAGLKSAEAQTSTEIEVLQFALNLEYLEAEFYTYALTGKGIEAYGIGINGLANGSNPASGGTTTGGHKVDFTEPFRAVSAPVAVQIGKDERAHVSLLRSALSSQAIAKPNLNLNALGFGFGTQFEFMQLSRIFEDIGVSAYAGAAGMLTTPAIITTAARILAAEAEHVASIRTQIAILRVPTTQLDAADLLPPPSGNEFSILSLASTINGLVATRTPGEVLYLAFGNQANATTGGFFPCGVNGAITISSGPAPVTNIE
jgi:hypothetical protein